jgi:predicted small lipoprotein YifL
LHRRAQTGLCLIIVLALSLAGCGRRGALEPPPGSPTPDAGAKPQASSADAPNGQTTPSDTGSALKPTRRVNKKIVPPKVDTPFDWLL